MKYLKVWTTFLELISTLQYDEIGRLFEMMLVYADSGKEPEEFEGNERFLWPVAKQQIDLAAAKNEILRQNGMKGGRPKAEETRENQTEPKETKENQSKAYKEKKRKEIESNKSESKERDAFFDLFWADYPNRVAKQDAVRAWQKLAPDEALYCEIMAGLRKWKASDEWTRDGGRFVPHPATWLNGRRWEDEVRPRPAVSAQGYDQRDYSEVNRRLRERQEMEICGILAKAGSA